ncbi:MAG: SHOCT domain-containing protein [Pseudomonadota bacterium]|nr:SHOCT domain-containing protein [Pseudomonadota bacterium]
MQQLTPEGQQKIKELAQKYEVSNAAVLALLKALVNGQGNMAQFNHPELGGWGQWMQGGRTMLSDMFDETLKIKVEGLCVELSHLLLSNQHFMFTDDVEEPIETVQQPKPQEQSTQTFSAATIEPWWPNDLGKPSATGGQNNMRYAYFADTARLAIDVNGHVTLHDTLDHQITGVAQQPEIDVLPTFTTQNGVIKVADLPIISLDGVPLQIKQAAAHSQNTSTTPSKKQAEVFEKIEKLAELKQKGILSEDEFAVKKSELLSKL